MTSIVPTQIIMSGQQNDSNSRRGGQGTVQAGHLHGELVACKSIPLKSKRAIAAETCSVSWFGGASVRSSDACHHLNARSAIASQRALPCRRVESDRCIRTSSASSNAKRRPHTFKCTWNWPCAICTTFRAAQSLQGTCPGRHTCYERTFLELSSPFCNAG